jgi:hypothetical protein
MKCKFGAPTQDGSKSSNTEDSNSLTSKTTKHLMFIKTKILKDKRLLSGRDITDGIRDGESSIWTNPERKVQRDTTPNSVSTSADHSTLDQECQCKELSNALAPTTLSSEDMSEEEPLKDSSSILPARPSSLNTGRTDPWTSNLTEDHPISE